MKWQLPFGLLSSLLIVLVLDSCKKDPCEEVICYNGGTCIDGTCHCPERYTGPACELYATPDTIKITEVRVHSFPETNKGVPWDTGGLSHDTISEADIFIELIKNGKYEWQGGVMFNADPDSITVWDIWLFELVDVFAEYEIRLIDFDLYRPNSIIGSTTFIPYYPGNGYPEKLVLKRGPVHFELDFEYSF